VTDRPFSVKTRSRDKLSHVSADFSSLTHCTQMREVHITQAAESSDTMRALLKRFQEIAGPGKGAPVVLAALARLGTTACDWIDGELRIEISGDAKRSIIAVSSSLGAGFAEKVFPDTQLPVPFEEFKRFVARATQLLEPLAVAQSDAIIVLCVAAEVRKTTVPPPNHNIDPSSLFKLYATQQPATPSVAMPTPALAIPSKK
jgi:hypothetical protein